jgi:hypothetical protein
MSVAVAASASAREGRPALFENKILKARIGETGPLLFQLPQFLSQLLHRLEKRILSRVCSRVMPLQRHLSVGSKATRTPITAIGVKTTGPRNLRVYFPLPEPIESDLGAKKHVIDKTV